MQDKEEGNLDEENCVKINMYMADSAEAAAAANGEESPSSSKSSSDGKAKGGSGSGSGSGASGSGNDSSRMDISGLGGGGLDNAALMQIMQGLNNDSSGGNSSSNNNDSSSQGGQGQGQVDTLSNILENLGMPQNSSSSSSSAAAANVAATPASNSTNTTSTPAAPSGGLTLSDLQGAMAGLATTSPPSANANAHSQLQLPGPPLSEVATPDAVVDSGILDDEEIKTKLIQLLPEGQRSEDKLMENLRSPQVVQCLKSLSAALEGEDGSSFNSILANFQLRPEDGAAALASGNPIQAFLDCVLKDVEREKGKKKEKDEDGDSEMKE